MINSTPPSRQDRREVLKTERRQRQRKQQAAQRRRRLLATLAGVIVVAVIAVVTIILVANQNADAPGATDLAPMTAVPDPYPGIAQQTRVLGDPNALRLVEYGDYQCPICQQAEEMIVPELVNRYVATGTLSLEFRDYLVIDGNLSQRDPNYDHESLRAAEGAMCAADQGQYWAFHSSLYRNHTGEGVGDFSDSRVKDLAAKLSLDTAAFNQCLDSGTYESAVQQQNSDAKAAGITGTPTFMIGDQKISGSSVDDYISQIDAVLIANGLTPPAEGAPTVPPAPTTDPNLATPVAVLPGRAG